MKLLIENWRGFLNEVKLADYQARYMLRADALGFGQIIPTTAKIRSSEFGSLTGLSGPPPPKLTITIRNGSKLNVKDTTKKSIKTLVKLAGAGSRSGSGFLNDYMNGELSSGDVFEIATALPGGAVYILCQIEAQEGFWNLNIMGIQKNLQFDKNNKLYTIV